MDPHDHGSRAVPGIRRQTLTPRRVGTAELERLAGALGPDLRLELAQAIDLPTAPVDELRLYAACERGRHLVGIVKVEHDSWGRAGLALEVCE